MPGETRKVNLLQTAYNVSATLAAAQIQTGLLQSPEEIAGFIEATKSKVYDDLSAIDDAHPAPPPQRRYGGNRGGGNGQAGLPLGTLVINNGKHGGKTLDAIFAEDADYLKWAANNFPNNFVKNKVSQFLQEKSQQEPQQEPQDEVANIAAE